VLVGDVSVGPALTLGVLIPQFLLRALHLLGLQPNPKPSIVATLGRRFQFELITVSRNKKPAFHVNFSRSIPFPGKNR